MLLLLTYSFYLLYICLDDQLLPGFISMGCIFLEISLFHLSYLICCHAVVCSIPHNPFYIHNISNYVPSFVPDLLIWVFTVYFLFNLAKDLSILLIFSKNNFWFYCFSLLFVLLSVSFISVIIVIIPLLLLSSDLVCSLFQSSTANSHTVSSWVSHFISQSCSSQIYKILGLISEDCWEDEMKQCK